MFDVLLEKSAWRDIQALPEVEQKRILQKVHFILSQAPYPRGKNPKRLTGQTAYRLRIGHYRVLYEIQDRTVVIYAIGHRKDVYR